MVVSSSILRRIQIRFAASAAFAFVLGATMKADGWIGKTAQGVQSFSSVWRASAYWPDY